MRPDNRDTEHDLVASWLVMGLLVVGLLLLAWAAFGDGLDSIARPPGNERPTCGFAQRGGLLVYTLTGPFLAQGSGLTLYAAFEPTDVKLLVWWSTSIEDAGHARGVVLHQGEHLLTPEKITEAIRSLEVRYGTDAGGFP